MGLCASKASGENLHLMGHSSRWKSENTRMGAIGMGAGIFMTAVAERYVPRLGEYTERGRAARIFGSAHHNTWTREAL